jgi:DNA mismatch repair protein MutS
MTTTILEDYIEYYNEYCEIHGKNNTTVFIQVGSFYEAYGTDKLGPDLLALSKLIGVIRSRKNKKKSVTMSNPYVLGFPKVSLVKFLDILIENNYVVVIVDQVTKTITETDTEKPKKKKKKEKEHRQVTNVYSKATYIENIDKNEGNYMVCVYITNDDQKDSSSLFSIGITGIDLSTGHVNIHEAYSTKYDEMFAFDEMERFMNSIDPKEMHIYYQDNTKEGKSDKNKSKRDEEYICNYLKINKDTCRFITDVNKKYHQMDFQTEMLKKVYKSDESMISPIEHLDLETNLYSLVSLVVSFDCVHNKNEKLLKNLTKPIRFKNENNLALGNNAVRQLDIIESNNDNTKCKYKSLFHVINKTETALGERFLRMRLLSPLIKIDELNNIYDVTDEIITLKLHKIIDKYMVNVKDIERLQRKMELQIIKPYELCMFIESYENIYDLILEIKKTKCKKIQLMLPDSEHIKNIKKMIDRVDKTFDRDELEKYSSQEIVTAIFKKDIHEDIDDLINNVDKAYSFMVKLTESLDGLIKTSGQSCVHIKKNNRDGYYLHLTNIKANILIDKITKLKEIKVDNMKIKSSLLIFKKSEKITKIYFPSIDQTSDDIEENSKKLEILSKQYFLNEVKKIHKKYNKTFYFSNKYIATLDYLNSSAKVALAYGYVRPTLKKNKCSCVSANKLRHPIIERIIEHEYIPHDIDLGKNMKGMLLYGVNAVGKSSLMKAIGLSVIMAQAGLFVPAEKFVLTPYESLYTRITGDDNIFRGLSSFSLEMVEVNAILKRSNKRTLVIGDEVCKGTEHISGIAIVAATILKLSDADASFIFATHLHEIMTLNEIKELQNVKAYHLGITYDEQTKSLIYDRTMKEGSGEHVYGITVARHIIQDKNFIDSAIKIKNQLLEIDDELITNKKSKYNSKLLVYECELCGKRNKKSHVSNLETHHINHQKDCENDLVKTKKYIQKNHKSNLIVLCNECHDKIHDNKIKINGYVMTSKGKKIK